MSSTTSSDNYPYIKKCYPNAFDDCLPYRANTRSLTYDFACPIPVDPEKTGWPMLDNVYREAFLCYSNKKTKNYDWESNARPKTDAEMALHVFWENLVTHQDPVWYKDRSNFDSYGGISLWLDPFDAHFKENVCRNEDPLYIIRDLLLEKYHERRFAADHHPQIRVRSGIVDRVKLFDVVNKKAKEAMKGRKDRQKSWRKKFSK